MEEQIEKYLNGDITRDALSKEALAELDQLEQMDQVMFQQIALEPKHDLATKIIRKSKRASNSWKWIKGWMLGVGVIIALTALIMPVFGEASFEVLGEIASKVDKITLGIDASTIMYTLVFVNLITLLLILDKLLSRKLKLNR